MTTEDEVLTEIAKRHLGVATLQTRNADGLDFYELAVWRIEEALRASFRAGMQSQREQQTRR